MIEVRIKKNGIVTHKSRFSTQGEVDVWIEKNKENKSWGRDERWVDELQCESLGEDASLKIDEQMVGGPDEERKQLKFAADFLIEQEDVTAQVVQAQKNSDALAYLASTDWYVIRNQEVGTAIPEEVQTLRAQARADIVR